MLSEINLQLSTKPTSFPKGSRLPRSHRMMEMHSEGLDAYPLPRLLYGCTFQHVATEHLKCGQSELRCVINSK